MTARSTLMVTAWTLGALVALLVIYDLARSVRRSPVVIVGPVELQRGMPGLAGKGMTRDQVIGLLGQPLRARETGLPPERWTDPMDPIPDDYFAGLYGEVGYFNDDTVCSLEFDLDEFAHRFGGELKLVLLHRGRSVLVWRRLTLAQAKKPSFYSRLGLKASQVRVNGAGLYFETAPHEYQLLQFSYEDGHLESVGVGWSP